MIIGYHHITRTGGAALVRRIHEAQRPLGCDLATLDATSVDEIDTRLQIASNLLFHSHNAFGIHLLTHLPITYFTVLRDPVAHTVSEFYWSKGLELNDATEEEIVHKLTKYVASFDHLNHQTYELAVCAQNRNSPEAHPTPTNMIGSGENLLPIALRNLSKHFVFVGQTERSDRTHSFLKDTLGFVGLGEAGRGFNNKSLASIKHGFSRRQGLPKKLLDEIAAKTEIDRLLYENSGFVDREKTRAIIADLPKIDKKFVCRPNEVWAFFIEGLIGIHARYNGPDDISSTDLSKWHLAFHLPVVEVDKSKDYIMRFEFGGFLTVPLSLSVEVGQSSETLIFSPGDQTKSLYCFVEPSSIVDGKVHVQLTAELLRPSDAARVQCNPLPYMLHNMLLCESLVVDLLKEYSIAPDEPGCKALLEGFAPAELGGLAWTVSSEARLQFRLNKALLNQLSKPLSADPFLLLEISLSPLLFPGKLMGQTLVAEISGRSPASSILRQTETISLLVLLSEITRNSGYISVRFHFPNALPLSEVIDHPDRVSARAFMFHKFRVRPVLDLTSQIPAASIALASASAVLPSLPSRSSFSPSAPS